MEPKDSLAQITVLVPDKFADDIASQISGNPFETASQVLDMLDAFEACFGRKGGGVGRWCERRGNAVVEPSQYFCAGSLTTKEFVFMPNDYIVRGSSIRDRVASFLRPGQTQRGVILITAKNDRGSDRLLYKCSEDPHGLYLSMQSSRPGHLLAGIKILRQRMMPSSAPVKRSFFLRAGTKKKRPLFKKRCDGLSSNSAI
ncbi:hypothetical protein niasHT_003661 [Heterodera trifolii]|uniref:Uncharacterized protein n=1 Tax=Heterodera trifolii TaxID=157864 RepID=A0ABD2MC66_9BILA